MPDKPFCATCGHSLEMHLNDNMIMGCADNGGRCGCRSFLRQPPPLTAEGKA